MNMNMDMDMDMDIKMNMDIDLDLELETVELEFSTASKVIAIMVKCTAIPSIQGSAFIVFVVLRNKQKRAKTYHRLLLAMSISDILSSTAIFVGSWAIPRGTEGVCKSLHVHVLACLVVS